MYTVPEFPPEAVTAVVVVGEMAVALIDEYVVEVTYPTE